MIEPLGDERLPRIGLVYAQFVGSCPSFQGDAKLVLAGSGRSNLDEVQFHCEGEEIIHFGGATGANQWVVRQHIELSLEPEAFNTIRQEQEKSIHSFDKHTPTASLGRKALDIIVADDLRGLADVSSLSDRRDQIVAHWVRQSGNHWR